MTFAAMDYQTFPIDSYMNTLVRVLDTIKYRDNNYDHQERVKNLQYAYSEAAKHFAQPLQQDTLQVNPKKLEVALATITAMVVYCWAKVSPETMAALTIHYTYCLLLDDSTTDPHPEMASYFEDLIHGRKQKHPFWRLVNDYMPKVLNHYGNFCAFNIIRSTMDCKRFPMPRVLDPCHSPDAGAAS